MTGKTMVALDEWSINTFMMLFEKLINKEYFDICILDKLRSGIEYARKDNDMLQNIESRKLPEYGVLLALHCINFSEMPNNVKSGIPGAILMVLGLNEETGLQLFGDKAWGNVKMLLEKAFGGNKVRVNRTGVGINTVEINGEHKHICELDGFTLEIELTKLKNEINLLYAKNAQANAGLRGFVLRIMGIHLPDKKRETLVMERIK